MSCSPLSTYERLGRASPIDLDHVYQLLNSSSVIPSIEGSFLSLKPLLKKHYPEVDDRYRIIMQGFRSIFQNLVASFDAGECPQILTLKNIYVINENKNLNFSLLETRTLTFLNLEEMRNHEQKFTIQEILGTFDNGALLETDRKILHHSFECFQNRSIGIEVFRNIVNKVLVANAAIVLIKALRNERLSRHFVNYTQITAELEKDKNSLKAHSVKNFKSFLEILLVPTLNVRLTLQDTLKWLNEMIGNTDSRYQKISQEISVVPIPNHIRKCFMAHELRQLHEKGNLIVMLQVLQLAYSSHSENAKNNVAEAIRTWLVMSGKTHLPVSLIDQSRLQDFLTRKKIRIHLKTGQICTVNRLAIRSEGSKMKAWEIKENLGFGKCSHVFRATEITFDGSKGKSVAIKFPRDNREPILGDLINSKYMLDQIHAAGLIEGIEPPHEFLGVQNEVYNTDLKQFTHFLKIIPIPQRVTLITQGFFHVLKGLEYVHSIGLQHTDIKPNNICIYQKGEDEFDFKLIDWGGTERADKLVEKFKKDFPDKINLNKFYFLNVHTSIYLLKELKDRFLHVMIDPQTMLYKNELDETLLEDVTNLRVKHDLVCLAQTMFQSLQSNKLSTGPHPLHADLQIDLKTIRLLNIPSDVVDLWYDMLNPLSLNTTADAKRRMESIRDIHDLY